MQSFFDRLSPYLTTDPAFSTFQTHGKGGLFFLYLGFKASCELLTLCFPQSVNVQQILTHLQNKSIINYRKYISEYRVWEGSDFNLDTALIETTQQLGRINLAEALTRRNKLMPVVARKYSIQMGVLRYFQPYYADIITPNSFFEKAEQPRIVFLLADGQDEREALEAKAKSYATAQTG